MTKSFNFWVLTVNSFAQVETQHEIFSDGGGGQEGINL
jgi:hypothetical protein